MLYRAAAFVVGAAVRRQLATMAADGSALCGGLHGESARSHLVVGGRIGQATTGDDGGRARDADAAGTAAHAGRRLPHGLPRNLCTGSRHLRNRQHGLLTRKRACSRHDRQQCSGSAIP